MSINQLYQATIIAHNKSPRHFGILPDATHIARGKNPLCGDAYVIYLKIEDNHIKAAQFDGEGCAISKSSGSLMTDAIIGMSLTAFAKLADAFLVMITDASKPAEPATDLGKLRVFEGVKDYPVRVKCATLLWRAAQAAVQESNKIVSTE